MVKITDKMIDIACDFWCNIIKHGKDHDNGDKSFTGFMCSFLANNNTEIIDDSKLKIFEEELKKQILKESKEKYSRYVSLYCDYGPGYMLYEAAEKAQIKPMQFPWKTGITIYENAVIENRPYARPENETDRILYCTRDYLEHMIKDIKDYLQKCKDSELEEWETTESRNDSIVRNTKRLQAYEDLLSKVSDTYTRK